MLTLSAWSRVGAKMQLAWPFSAVSAHAQPLPPAENLLSLAGRHRGCHRPVTLFTLWVRACPPCPPPAPCLSLTNMRYCCSASMDMTAQTPTVTVVLRHTLIAAPRRTRSFHSNRGCSSGRAKGRPCSLQTPTRAVLGEEALVAAGAASPLSASRQPVGLPA